MPTELNIVIHVIDVEQLVMKYFGEYFSQGTVKIEEK